MFVMFLVSFNHCKASSLLVFSMSNIFRQQKKNFASSLGTFFLLKLCSWMQRKFSHLVTMAYWSNVRPPFESFEVQFPGFAFFYILLLFLPMSLRFTTVS